MKKNIETLLVLSKKGGLRVNAEEATHSSVSSEQNAVQNVNIKTGNKYEVLPKILRNLTIKKFLTVTTSFHRLLRSSALGHVYSDPSMFPMISCIPESSQM